MPPSSPEQSAAAATLVVAMPGRTEYLADHLADGRDLLHVTILAADALPKCFSASFATSLLAVLQNIDCALEAIAPAVERDDGHPAAAVREAAR